MQMTELFQFYLMIQAIVHVVSFLLAMSIK